MADISKEQVKHVAHLARLTFTEEEVEAFAKDLGDIIGFAEQLNELDTEGVEETTHVLDIANVLREDKVHDSLAREEALKNAPAEQEGQVKVPKVLGE
ncbi:aspartyl-tRNA(Asn)/glutamyl-tRNA(Gln) amidotransferase subunit C [Pullulanibacillus pueri]|uniref:Aspartyl/glutamyl-tRNA(Asn/Gln) amidotransferase subunit C n=1 Tax=Pullulanibacillus pueri TaxID=1437324 RepID=A0A8J2ZW65_9BACL|nr:Asp-tRNA(Asn)/Glu-tRNA(Gln) amidotransferase subunit GatC [Pullulanibacillus pueri]MBM7682739.1 aspartyl-tRNA(Asn)/glutamyl-tRNA(Gln) amidotransferase subunit C [Pullulanibacillus pueri]GGH82999.1 aspartyl/glutamyl-tRNA(Asn/Gln) amidotransferase subunit C [Pullulanibacillus pueri]